MRQLLFAFAILIGISMLSCSTGDDTKMFDVTVSTSPADAGMVAPADTSIEEGQQLSLQVDASDEYLFSHWSGDIDRDSRELGAGDKYYGSRILALKKYYTSSHKNNIIEG